MYIPSLLQNSKSNSLEVKNKKISLIPIQLLIIGLGISVLYSNSSEYIFRRQLVWIVVGSIICAFIYFSSLERLWSLATIIAWLTILLNILPLIPGLGISNAGSARWIHLFGISFQSSETLRLGIILFLAKCFSQYRGPSSKVNYKYLLLRPLVFTVIASMLILFQKDYSTSIIILILAGAITLIARAWHYLCALFIISITGTLVAFFLLKQSFRVARISDWLGGGSDQIRWVHSTITKGGWFGEGLGRGSDKYKVPAEMTDFPISSLGEEAGFIGILFILLLFLVFVIQGLRIAKRTQNPFVKYLVIGFSLLFYIQVIVNLSVTAGLLPVTGQPLPFFSVGGTTILTSMIVFSVLNLANKATLDQESHLQDVGRT